MTDFFVPSAPAAPPENPFLSRILTAPSAITGGVLGMFGQQAQPIDQNLQRNLTSLSNKYAELSPLLNQLPPQLREAMIDYDSRRVARGANPLTQDQTVMALQTALNNRPATPSPERSPWNLFGNFKGDLSDLLKSIPRIPIGLAAEAMALPNIGRSMQENRQQGMNPLAALLNAPGVRMLPGAFVAGQITQGPKGLTELARHPLFTALDVLPAATAAAASTDVGRAAIAQAEAMGRRGRPLAAVMTGRVVRGVDGEPILAELPGRVVREADGDLVRATSPDQFQIGRNALGQSMDRFRQQTRLGQAIDAFGGRTGRDIARVRGGLEQRAQSLLEGFGTPSNELEALAQRASTTLAKYADEYPFLAQSRKAAGAEMDAARTEFFNQIERGDVANLNPQLVAELRTLQADLADYNARAGILGQYDGEWFDIKTANKLRQNEGRVAHAQRMLDYNERYLRPSAETTVDDLRGLADDVINEPSRVQRGELGRAFENTLDALGIDISAIRSARSQLAQGKGTVAAWNDAVSDALDGITGPLTPRRNLEQITEILRQYSRTDPQVARLVDAVARGDRHRTTAVLKNLYERKPPTFPDELYPALRDDVRSMSRRIEFEQQVGKRYTDKRVEMRRAAMERTRSRTAPTRFHGILAQTADELRPAKVQAKAEQALGRELRPEEVADVSRAVLTRDWSLVPGVREGIISRADMDRVIRTVEDEVVQTWRGLRAEGMDPVFVHRVAPGRANQALNVNIGPLPVSISQGKQRAFDLSPQVTDMQVSLRHQAAEMLQQQYNEQFITEIVDSVGKTQADLRTELRDMALEHMVRNPSLNYEAAFQTVLKQMYRKFNPEDAGMSWGGVKLNKFRQEDVYIPIAHFDNLKSYAKPPSIFSTVTDPLTRAFRYSVIGLSPSIIVNNFFSNSVAVAAESGPMAFRHWAKAREWLRDPSMIPNERLKEMIVAEIPHMTQINRDAWLKARLQTGMNAGKAFHDSAFTEAVRAGKRGLDGVVEKSMRLQRLGDNVYRAMQYMEEYDKAVRKGAPADLAATRALTAVQQTLVDYTSFTPIERSAMRTIIPFYSYMGHAARFIMRYPIDHPVRAAIAGNIAQAERERLGALPGGFLSMVPLPSFLGGSPDEKGSRNYAQLRMFDPFGDMSDLTTVSGWLAATNPLIQTALQQAGIYRGEAELYPTLRYNPDTGRMERVRSNVLLDLFHNTVPRAGLLTSALGLNPQFKDVMSRDPAAANRMLLTMAGVPRLWRNMNPYQEMFKSEIARQTSQNDVRNEAMKSGDWGEAMRYPGLRELFAALQSADPNTLAQYAGKSPEQVANAVRAQLTAAG